MTLRFWNKDVESVRYHHFFLASILAFMSPVYADDAVPVTSAQTEAVATKAQEPPNPDPWEKFNRSVFKFNDTLDHYALRPVAKGYRNVTPTFVQTGITNFFSNLKFPIVFLNDVLQGKIRQAGKDTTRFIVNTTAGVAGFVDVAKHIPIPANDEDFGQTLGKWGVKSGPYVVLPFFGPSSARDAVGFTVDSFSTPRRYYLDWRVDAGLTLVDAVNTRAGLLDVEEIVQGDRYLFIRDLYLQRREFVIHDGQVADPFLDDEFDDPAEEAPVDGSAENGVVAPSEDAAAKADEPASPPEPAGENTGSPAEPVIAP